jgi:flavin-binding protein dodecin
MPRPGRSLTRFRRKERPIAVARVIEICATSTDSFDGAIAQGISKASETARRIQGAWVKEQKVEVSDDGNLTEYRVDLKVTFELDLRSRSPWGLPSGGAGCRRASTCVPG